MKSTGFVYGGRCTRCGALCALISEPPLDASESMRKHIANHIAIHIADWIKDGLSIERVTSEYARENFRLCKCDILEKRPTQQLSMFDESVSQHDWPIGK